MRASQNSRTFRAPGRVNLIGEHTDYNDGFVLPVAIEFAACVDVSERADRRLVIRSENYSETCEFDLDQFEPSAKGHWSDYVRGVAIMLERDGYRMGGADLRIRSDVPMGAGLSSSAAIEVASALALLRGASSRELASVAQASRLRWQVGDLPHRVPDRLEGRAGPVRAIDRTALALLCQRAENEFVGVRCGIMDQFIACHARSGHALLLDCRTLEHRYVPLPHGVKLVIANTGVRHSLAAGEYDRRRSECESGVAYFGRSLRDVTLDELEREGRGLSDVVYRRCKHVITENARVLAAATALEREDLQTFGELMYQSHRSLKEDYEVSCSELDALFDIAARVPGVYGSRMTGGGFGGCTVSLVDEDFVDGFRQAVGSLAEIYVSGATEGAGEL